MDDDQPFVLKRDHIDQMANLMLDEQMKKAIENIARNHRQILDDWCKAYLAQRYQEGMNIQPGSFTLCEQVPTYHKGQNCYVKRYWFEEGTPRFEKGEEV
jgi:hypothetical protein